MRATRASHGRGALIRRLLGRFGIGAAVAVTAVALAAPGARAVTVHPGQCAWPLKADPDVLNVAWPDEGAQYRATPFVTAPGTSMRIHGRFPHARYMSFHLYEGSTPVDALTDVDIAADSGINPFVEGARRDRPGSTP